MEEMQKIKNKRMIALKPWLMKLLFIGCFLLLAGTAKSVQAATLYLHPVSGEHGATDAFAVSVYVTSADQAINAASGVVIFPADKLEVSSVVKSGSIFNLWVQEPSFSNVGGTVNFEGIVLNPGFTGAGGKIITINFKAKASGIAALSFSSASVLANDGKGTNILTGLGTASFTLGSTAVLPTSPPANPTEKPATAEPEPSTASAKPSAPQVSSATHPDQDQWSNNNNPTFTWSLSKDITGVSIYSDHNPNANPGSVSDGIFTSQTYKNVKDGVWYFHIRLKNSQGWGPATHYRYQIDTQPPESFQISFPHGDKTEDPIPVINFNTTDQLSGIDGYLVKIGDQDFIKITTEQVQSNPYALPPQDPGQKVILVRALDKAGNFSQATGEITITALKAPVITDYTKDITNKDLLRILGMTYSDAEITIFITDNNGDVRKEIAKSTILGNFAIAWPRHLEAGTYSLVAQATDSRGAKSELSEKITFEVKPGKWLGRDITATTLILVASPLILVVLALVYIIFHCRRKFFNFKNGAAREAGKIQCGLRKSVCSLEKDLATYLDLLKEVQKKRSLTVAEKKMNTELKKHLNKIKKL
ncbi:MAG: hypothetical protein V1692_02035 [bacterium]